MARILNVTNHGIHEWNLVLGLPDTGGQNVYVNELSNALAHMGNIVTIANRGGYRHPVTNELRQGIFRKNNYQELVFIQDHYPHFVEKEYINPYIPYLAEDLYQRLPQPPDIIISHFWDGLKVAHLFNTHYGLPHYWVPHELAAMKAQNIKENQLHKHFIQGRLDIVKEILPKISGVISTSKLITESLQKDYNYNTDITLTPCINTTRFAPKKPKNNDAIWDFLSQENPSNKTKIQTSLKILEISRTDFTKRKDFIVQVFKMIAEQYPDTILIMNVDNNAEGNSIKELITSLNLQECVVTIDPSELPQTGHHSDRIPKLFNMADIYVSASIMEGFGMAVQEAAATKTAIIGSNKIPCLTEVLAVNPEKRDQYTIGKGGIVAEKDNFNAFVNGLIELVKNKNLRNTLAENAYNIVIPEYTWFNKVHTLTKQLGI